ncbi:inositol monophosphatase family protein [Acinetobacter pittii]|uniref:inositol monophosphatase family protein n=1 Tax=Acinetobacter pittii TaxID=48296 RepID=UPI00233E79D7|nr:inositol monophosphatase family protein [Acinetobacter baumannii]
MTNIFPDIYFLHKLADVADAETLPRFRSHIDLEIQTKLKKNVSFDPVTIADKAAEYAMRKMITEYYPDHSIMGEEFGAIENGEIRWILDPIDGTRPYLLGIPVWGTLIGLEHNDKMCLGMLSQPFTNERFWSDGESSFHQYNKVQKKLKIQRNKKISEAILHINHPRSSNLYPHINFTELSEQVLMTRYGAECYAFAMLAAGYIDICFEFSLQPYDIAALIPIIENAGGVISTLDGSSAHKGGIIVAASSQSLHEQALKILNS